MKERRFKMQKLNTLINTNSVSEENEEILKIMAYMLLKKLQLIYEQKEKKVLIVQRKGNIVKNTNGIPVDRPGWFWLPFMKEMSREFQPREIGGIKVYHVTSDFFECEEE